MEARGDDTALPEGTRLRDFEIQGVIGEGGFSIVYKAWDHSLHRHVALKEYIPRELAGRSSNRLSVTVRSESKRDTFDLGMKSFINEARLLAAFDHPSLVKVHQFWSENGTAYMVMPLYIGLTLKQFLVDKRDSLSEAWLLELLEPICDALEVLHAERCFHRDISPDNILIQDSNGRPVLLDFGAARQVVGETTRELTVILKNGYAPLEQYGQIPGMKQGPWTDVYALAAVMFFAIKGKTAPMAVGRLAKDLYEPLAGSRTLSTLGRFSLRFLGAIDHGLGVRPQDRPQSIEDFRNEIGIQASSRHAVHLKTRSRLPRVASGAALLVVLAAGAGAVVWKSRSTDGQSRSVAGVATLPQGASAGVSSTRATTLPIQGAQAAGPLPATGGGTSSPAYSAEAGDAGSATLAAREAQREVAKLSSLSTSESIDASATMSQVQVLQRDASASFDRRAFLEAESLSRQAQGLAKGVLNQCVQKAVERYAAEARFETRTGNFRAAQGAIDKAKSIQALHEE